MAGNPLRALELVEEAIAVGGRLVEIQPEFGIMKADLLQQVGGYEADEMRSLYRLAATNAEAHQLHLGTLRALTRLVTLNRHTGVTPDASEELAVVYDTFTEGFDEIDMVAARDVLGLA